jgi:hypothetical protein
LARDAVDAWRNLRVLRIESARLLEVTERAEQILRGAFRIAFGLLLAALRLAVALVEVQLFKLPPHFLFARLRVAMFGTCASAC